MTRPAIRQQYEYNCSVCGPTITTQHSKNMCWKCYIRSRNPPKVKFCETCSIEITGQRRRRFCTDCAKRRAYDRSRAWELGISREEYRGSIEQALVVQQGLCAICLKEGPLHRDHDHTTGAFRGMLCGNCNRGLGVFFDSKEALQRAIDYLNG